MSYEHDHCTRREMELESRIEALNNESKERQDALETSENARANLLAALERAKGELC